MSHDPANKIEFKPGMTFLAKVPASQTKVIKIYIDHVLPSKYEGEQLIVYRLYSKYKQRWYELMCYDMEMRMYIEFADNTANKPKET